VSDYEPIACALHDQFEAAAVTGATLTLRWPGQDAPYVGRILDIQVRDGAEYLVLEGNRTIRLDRIEVVQVD
jgi:transcriptional antiterminator Rof (Rho-off)